MNIVVKILIFIIFILPKLCSGISDKDSVRSYIASRVVNAPKIDGDLSDQEWSNLIPTSNFKQNRPIEGAEPTFKTEVKIVYTDYAVYVAAMMFDEAPDSILKQLGKRDDEGLNSDYFYFKIDTYNNHQDAYQFGVNASGVQVDSRFSDYTYNAVWKSAVKINTQGWTVEMEIPYSAIRFPNQTNQKWGMQLVRSIRRNREFNQWALIPSGVVSFQQYWGHLEGISNIKTPVRLSLTPYLASSIEQSPEYNNEGGYVYATTKSYSLGADLKYGIDDRFTLDMTLFPDFGQVQSDKKIKNLGYEEVVYDENRPFFQEGIDLFNKGELFYSRRIGRVPQLYNSIYSNLQDGETVIENPDKAKLLNATKISGRTDNGIGLGFFNAITDNMYAKIRNADGTTRRVLTEPLTNYNILVIDKQFKNNSNIYLINTSTIRTKEFEDADVTGAGFTLSNTKSTYSIIGNGVMTESFTKVSNGEGSKIKNLSGYKYDLAVDEIAGKVKFGASRKVVNPSYDATDLGYFEVPGIVSYRAHVDQYLYQPWKIFRDASNYLGAYVNHDYKTGKMGENQIYMDLFANLLSYNAIFGGYGVKPFRDYDFYEAREPGRVFHGLRYYYTYIGFSTDYRKKLAVDYNFNMSNFLDRFITEGYNNSITIRVRPLDKLFIRTVFQYNFDPFNVGYANTADNGDILIGGRRLDTYITEMKATYAFNENMNITLNGRHYWISGKYKRFFTLLDDGELEDNYTYTENNDFSYNIFNIDLVYEWRFAPGSVLNIIYKNEIQDETQVINRNFSKNFSTLINAPQTNLVSIKLLYYLDYQKVISRFNKNV